ncbi:ABC transporter ATP-binding protein [Lactobacillus helveticus]|uniref:ABC transporter n=1 Tax=Lactobacillus helveticus TaxID=1587 RepID=A0AAU8XX07_LACHE|nr:ABC transporter ATP-binding protein [Lactobacillus helveticus]AUI75307.1 ABC transporter [Lactobacillus helveticus]MCT3432485.1 ABC transporter ATP-binding protein [Lactobacillus helveticus]MCT3433492.1 ABC transporter ATP-binding protein [Lactobacillus helveticus]NRO49223.1 Protein glycosylation K [Lactobacillus helveticus]PXZ14534.1 ABC transporter ATP-binding protein [Lactobacillus helveticus]
MFIKDFIRINRLRFFFITLLSVLSGVGGILAGYIQMYWLTYIKDQEWIKTAIATTLMVICWFFAQSVIYFVQYLNNVQEEELFKKNRDQIAKHYFKDQKFHKVSAFQNRLTNDFNIIKDSYYEWYIIIPFYGSMFVASLLALITIHWSIFALSLIIDVISYFLPKLISKRLEKATTNLSNKNNDYLNVLSKWFSGLAELKRYSACGKLLLVQSQSSKKLEKANVNQIQQQQLLNIINGISMLLSTIILLGTTGILVEQKLAVFGAILSVQNFATNVSVGMQEMIQGLTMMKSVKSLMQKVNVDAMPTSLSNKNNVKPPFSIEIHDLELSFPNGEVLKYPDLKINQGEKVLLTGDSGSGKTTLFKLILGIVKPSHGTIIFKDKKGNIIQPDMSKIGYIPQDPQLFPGTIKQNITMFNENLNQKVEPVLKLVTLSKDLKQFTNGVDTTLNLDNLNISGGQRQKVVLARAEVHNSQLLLIDEGTGAVDHQNTLNILRNLLQKDITIVFVAHSFDKNMKKLFDREIRL